MIECIRSPGLHAGNVVHLTECLIERLEEKVADDQI